MSNPEEHKGKWIRAVKINALILPTDNCRYLSLNNR